MSENKKEKTGCKNCNFDGFILVEKRNRSLAIERCNSCKTFDSNDDAVDYCFQVACEFRAGRLIVVNNTKTE